MVEVLLRQCFAQSRLRGGSSAPLTEVMGTICLKPTKTEPSSARSILPA